MAALPLGDSGNSALAATATWATAVGGRWFHRTWLAKKGVN